MILSKPPSSNIETSYLKLISKITGIKYNILDIFRKKYGDEVYFILNMLADQDIKKYSTYRLNDIEQMIHIVKYIENKDNMLNFTEKIKILSENLKISANKVIQLYEEYKYQHQKDVEI